MIPTVICVPARNEAEALPALLAGLAGQVGCDVTGLTLCVALDACTDGSGALLRGMSLPFALRIGALPDEGFANAGRARRFAMGMGLGILDGADGVLLTTDADSVPAPDWIAAAIRALRPADVAAGRILRHGSGCSPAQDRIEAYYDRLHALRRALDPVGWEDAATHHCTGGANLAFRADAYRALGGFAAVASGEDARIVDEAARAGFRVRRDAAMLVHTSARRIGRAPTGLASALSELDRDPGTVRVGHPADAAWQYRRHAQARAAFARLDDAGMRDALGRAIGLDGDHVIGVARDCPNAEAFAMRIVPAVPHGPRHIAIGAAEAALAAIEPPPATMEHAPKQAVPA